METILELDVTLFHWVNESLGNGFFDAIMPWVRNKYIWAPLYVWLIVFFIVKYKALSLYIILGLLITVTLSDTVSSRLIKHRVERVRPCNDKKLKDEVIKRIPCGPGYSFTSSHAANHFAMAIFLAGILKGVIPFAVAFFFCWAVLIGFAQVYVGVHYPLDVIGGALVGLLIGYVTLRATRILLSGRKRELPDPAD